MPFKTTNIIFQTVLIQELPDGHVHMQPLCETMHESFDKALTCYLGNAKHDGETVNNIRQLIAAFPVPERAKPKLRRALVKVTMTEEELETGFEGEN